MDNTHIISAGAVTSLGFDLAATTIAMDAKLDNFKDSHFVADGGEGIAASMIYAEQLAKDCPQHGIAKLRVMLQRAMEASLANLQDNLPDTLANRINKPGTATYVDAASIDNSTNDVNSSENDIAAAPIMTPKQAFFAKFRWSVIFVLSPDYGNQLKLLKKMLEKMPILAKATTYEFTIGSAGGGMAMEQARQLLLADRSGMVMVAAMDTWLDPHIINQGLKQNRILGDESDVGCIPAEAAAAVVLSKQSFDNSTALKLCGVGIDSEKVMLADIDNPCMGRGLRNAFREALNNAQLKMSNMHLRVSDVTGEEYFFEESILAYDAVLREPMPAGYELLISSSYLGDIRAVSGIYALSYIWQLAQLNKFNDKHAIVQLSSPSSDKRSAVVVYAQAANKVTDSSLYRKFVSDVIVPDVIQQHIEEASLYWLRRADTLWSANSHFDDVGRFDTLMQSHLLGISIAGKQGFAMTCEQLAQWETADEAFVNLYSFLSLVNSSDDSSIILTSLKDKIASLNSQAAENNQVDDTDTTDISAHPLEDTATVNEELIDLSFIDLLANDDSLVSGTAAALLMSNITQTKQLIQLLWQSNVPNLQLAILPFLCQNQKDYQHLITAALESQDNRIRTKILQLIGNYHLVDLTGNLVVSAKYDDDTCRYAAAMSLALLNNDIYINNYDVDKLIGIEVSFKHFMLWCYSVAEPVFAAWLQQAQTQKHRRWILIWSIFFRSDTAHLPILVELLQQADIEEHAKICCYAIEHLTGLNVEDLEMWIQDDDIPTDDDDDDNDDLEKDTEANNDATIKTNVEIFNPSQENMTVGSEKDDAAEANTEAKDEVADDHWTHPHQVELMQLGLLYPDIPKVLDYLKSNAEKNYKGRVINGQAIASLSEDAAFEFSMPQLWIYALHQKRQGKNNVFGRLMAYDLC